MAGCARPLLFNHFGLGGLICCALSEGPSKAKVYKLLKKKSRDSVERLVEVQEATKTRLAQSTLDAYFEF